MKKTTVLTLLVSGVAMLLFSSYKSGPAYNGYNLTGAKGSATSCGGDGCHGGNSPATAVAIAVDSASVPVSAYTPGQTYTIVVTGTNSSGLPDFGFQLAAVSGTGSYQVQAGSFTALPAHVYADPLASLKFVEHGRALPGTSAGNYSVSFQWVAPAAGTGNVTIYCTLNAVNGNGDADAGDVSQNTNIVLPENASTGVAVVNNEPTFLAYPNPVCGTLNMDIEHLPAGSYSLQVISIDGRAIENVDLQVTGNSFHRSVSTAKWPQGLYIVRLQNGSMMQTQVIAKQ